ncbi:MAG TPA: DUF3187 family protein, partial [Gammaproteobacteria bacterium]
MLNKNPARLLFRGVFYCLLFLSHKLYAVDVAPFSTRDQNPLVMIFGLPVATSAKIITSGESSFITSLNISNTINRQQTGNEFLFVDAESHQLNLMYERGLSDQWMLRVQLPLIGHSGGFLDASIDSYHQALGLPEDIRPLYPRDQLNIRYDNGGSTLIDLQNDTSGIGDISLQLARQVKNTHEFALSYWGSIKLPTGDSSKLTGSDSTDLALWLASHTRASEVTALYGNLGILFMSNGEILKQQQKNTSVFAVAGIQYHAWQSVLLKAQIDAHSALYKTDMNFLDDVIQLTFGGTV